MGGFFQSLHDAFTGGAPDSPTAQRRNAIIGSQQATTQSQQLGNADTIRKQQMQDLDFHQKMMNLGANYVHDSGLVEQPVAPDQDDTNPGPTSIMRQADKTRVIKHKTAEGDTVQYEIPTPEEQLQRQAQLRMTGLQANQPAQQLEAGQEAAAAQAKAEGTAVGTGTGKTEAEKADVAARGVDLDEPTAKQYMLPAGRYLPEQLLNAAGKANPAAIRAGASTANAHTRADAEQARQEILRQQNEERLQHQDQWHKAADALGAQRNGIAANRVGQAAVRQRQLVGDQQLHEKSLNLAYGEEQKQIQTQGLLDENPTTNFFGQESKEPAVKDGEEFIDPFSQKKMTMNYAQRLRLKNSLQASQQQSQSLRQRAGEISQRYGLDKFAQTPAQPGANGGAAPAQPQQAAPQASGGAQQRYKVGDKVRTKSGQTLTVKGYDSSGKVIAE